MLARVSSDGGAVRGNDRREGGEPNDAGGENSRSPEKLKTELVLVGLTEARGGTWRCVATRGCADGGRVQAEDRR